MQYPSGDNVIYYDGDYRRDEKDVNHIMGPAMWLAANAGGRHGRTNFRPIHIPGLRKSDRRCACDRQHCLLQYNSGIVIAEKELR